MTTSNDSFRCPSTRFGAAFDIIGSARAGIGDECAAGGRAFGCGDANARSILFACAGAVKDCTFGNCAAVHEGSAEDSSGCEEREIFHFKWDVRRMEF